MTLSSRKTTCEWCHNPVHVDRTAFSEIVEGTFCEECVYQAEKERQAECSHSPIKKGDGYICEDCKRRMEERGGEILET